jgi:hypothetical protein
VAREAAFAFAVGVGLGFVDERLLGNHCIVETFNDCTSDNCAQQENIHT